MSKKDGRRRSAIDPAVADLLATDRRAKRDIEPAEPIQPASIPPPVSPHTNKAKAKPEEKTVTSIRVPFSTLAKVHKIKIHALDEGRRLTIGDIIAEAVADLFRKKGLSNYGKNQKSPQNKT